MVTYVKGVSEPAPDPSSLVDLLRWRAFQHPDEAAYLFLVDGEDQRTERTYAQMDRQARAIAAELQSFATRGQRALLLYPPGLEFIAAFFGCLYAGITAVPAYPPDPDRINRSLPRLRAIAADSEASIVLTVYPVLSMAQALFIQAPELKYLRWMATETTIGDDDWREYSIATDTPIFLQYTSGSTGAPKGVMLSHDNLLHNAAMVFQALEHTPDDKYVSWLPAFHDMGFMAGILQPLYAGIPAILMSPVSFLKRPLRWLAAISRYQATISGGPNFAYDLCVRKISAEERATLDLRRWSVAFNGAEPIRAETLIRFAEAFEPCGFRLEKFYCCYGLAEATLIVSGGRKTDPPVLKSVQSTALEKNQVVETTRGDQDVRLLVGCGRSLLDQETLIVDPETCAPCLDGQVGEIWVRGPSVAQGYWNRPEESEHTFRSQLADGAHRGSFLRTGDLGFISDGNLFITGRLKDLIIIRGRNLYPQDIEMTTEQSDIALKPGCGAAFSVNIIGEEQLVIVQEIDGHKESDLDEILRKIHQNLTDFHEVQACAIVFVKAGSIHKTSSGKIQRRACKVAFLNNQLDVVKQWRATAMREDVGPALTTAEARQSREAIETWLASQLAARLGVGVSQISLNEPITRYGLDSLTAIELTNRIELHLGIRFPTERWLEGRTIIQLADSILDQLAAPARIAMPSIEPVSRDGPLPMSFAQGQFWMMDQLEPGSPAFNIPVALRFMGPLNVTALEWSIDQVVQRHEALRTTFIEDGSSQIICPSTSVSLAEQDLRKLPQDQREAEAQRRLIEEARRPFNLTRGPLLRPLLLRLEQEEHVLLITMHHIISDGWSVGVMLNELASFYRHYTKEASAPLPQLPIQYADYAFWQRRLIRGEYLDQLVTYWRKKLDCAAFLLKLPVDRPRPPSSLHQGARRSVLLQAELVESLKSFGSDEGATLFMTLLASFQALLRHYSGQEDIILISPSANRDLIETRGIVGCLRNMLVYRANLSGDPSFRELIGRVKEVCLEAYGHRHLPIEKLVEELHLRKPKPDTPLFPVMFAYQSFPAEVPQLPGLTAMRLEVPFGISNRDLSLYLDEYRQGLLCTLEYDSELFNVATIEAILQNFRKLLQGVVTDSDRPLSKMSATLDALNAH
jgi:acyl-CoA synthetase (AMP-forming)/AMP-acid ligase II/acyl carrier protein